MKLDKPLTLNFQDASLDGGDDKNSLSGERNSLNSTEELQRLENEVVALKKRCRVLSEQTRLEQELRKASEIRVALLKQRLERVYASLNEDI